MRSCECPNCGAALQISGNKDYVFCEYCGSKIMLDDLRSPQQIAEEARLKEAEAAKYKAETDRIIRLKKLRNEERLNRNRRHKKQTHFMNRGVTILVWLILSAILAFIGISGFISCTDEGLLTGAISAFLIWGSFVLVFKKLPEMHADRETARNGGIKFPRSLNPIENQNYQEAAQALEAAGFTRVECINLHDLIWPFSTKISRVASIKVNGKEVVKVGHYYPPDAIIGISYHGL